MLDDLQAVVAAYRYDPFGILLANTGSLTQPYGFSTKRYDPDIGMIHYEYRNYFPAIGRWGTRDPLGEAGGMNLYAFVGNNPVNWVDPWGEQTGAGEVALVMLLTGIVEAYILSPHGQEAMEALGHDIANVTHAVTDMVGGLFAPDHPPVDSSAYSCSIDDYVNPLTFNHLFSVPDQRELDKMRRDAEKTTPLVRVS